MPAIAFSQTGKIEGTAYNNITQEPLVGAEVRIVQTDERQKTDENGKFVFSAIPEGAYTLVTTSLDTELTQETSILVVAGETSAPEIYVGRALYRLEEVEVTDERDPKTVSKKSIQSKRLRVFPAQVATHSAPFPLSPVLVSQTISAAHSISEGDPMRTISTTSTEYLSIIRITLVDSSHL